MKLTNITMFIYFFLILVCLFTSTHAAKETVAHGSSNNDVNLILNLIKRLGDPRYNYQPEDQEESKGDLLRGKQSESASNELQNLQAACEPIIQQGSIIKTTESIKAGAIYIDSVKNVKTNADCLEYCCQNSTCDVAVYQDKDDKYCYLFGCNGRCIFKSHSGYLVNTIKIRKSSEHPEEDLQSLNGEGAGSNSDENKPVENVVQKLPEKVETVSPVSEGTTTKSVVTPETNPPELVITPHSVGLGGFCTQDRQCEDPNAVCGHGNCVCRNTYYIKEGICRRICQPSEYECFELGTLSRGPECISRSQLCDSYLNCADGSDEFNCENNEFPSGMRSSKSGNLHKAQDKLLQSSPPRQLKSNTSNIVQGENAPVVKPDLNPTKLVPAATSSKNKTDSIASPSPPVFKPFQESHSEKKHIFMSSEKVIIANTDAEGPIIALSLGLAFTIILLVLVGCRLKNVRHRLRKGRPLHQNEADYLINGMYL